MATPPNQSTRKSPLTTIGLVILVVLAGYLIWQQMGRSRTTSLPEDMTKEFTIRDRETGDEWTMTRGQIEKVLWGRPSPLNPEEGLVNPKTGKPNGFPISQWEETVQRVNRGNEIAAKIKMDPNEAKKKPDR